MEEGWRRMTMHKSTIVKNTIVESLSVILAALMLTACGANTNTETDVKVLEETEIVEATPEETSEVQSTPKENNSEAVEKPVVTAPVEEEEVDDEIIYISVESSEDAMTNLLAEGKDANDYSSAKDYIEKVKARGMGDTLSDTLAVFNRCGFEYCGYDVSDLEMSLWKDDDFSEKVIITADGDILYYLRTGYSGRANDLKSGYQDYKC